MASDESTPASTQQPADDDRPADQPRVVPGQEPGAAVPPVPAPGAVGISAPAVSTSQAASPEDGIHAADKEPDSDASVSSPGSWTSLAVPGKPDGEVDTRAR